MLVWVRYRFFTIRIITDVKVRLHKPSTSPFSHRLKWPQSNPILLFIRNVKKIKVAAYTNSDVDGMRVKQAENPNTCVNRP